MSLHTLVYLFLLSLSLSAQDFKVDANNTSFWDNETQQPITFINDSTYLYGYDLQIKQVKNLNTDDSNLSKMEVAQINGNTFLYDSAGGVVVEYANQTFTRHDKSFSHRSQYYSAHFTYNGHIYLLGGYGLFTTKNILTRYDFEAREWFLVETSGDIPKFITSDFFVVNDDVLYLINKGNHVIHNKQRQQVFSLNLNNFTFKNLGNIATKLLDAKSSNIKINKLSDGRLLYVKGLNTNLVIDFKANTVSHVKMDSPLHYKSKILKYSPETNTYIIKNLSFSNEQLVYNKLTNNDLKYNILNVQTLYEDEGMQIKKAVLYVGIFFLLTGAGVLSQRGYKKYIKLNIYLNKRVIKHKGYSIKGFTEEEYEFLRYLAQHQDYIQLLTLMQELKYDGSYDALKKKRKILIHQIKDKLKPYLGDKVEQLFIIANNENDRRYKQIRLNPDLIIVKK